MEVNVPRSNVKENDKGSFIMIGKNTCREIVQKSEIIAVLKEQGIHVINVDNLPKWQKQAAINEVRRRKNASVVTK